jgi:hypothetical protein
VRGNKPACCKCVEQPRDNGNQQVASTLTTLVSARAAARPSFPTSRHMSPEASVPPATSVPREHPRLRCQCGLMPPFGLCRLSIR